MEEKNQTGIVPGQDSGISLKAEKAVALETDEEARAFFQTVRKRLLDVNNWKNIAGELSAEFQLTDEKGRPIQGAVRQGCYFKIDIPGPGSKSGKGYDWVNVEEVKEVSEPGMESLGIRVRPAQNPEENEGGTAHFYDNESTSNFTVTREGKKITAAIYDRNIKPNVEGKNIIDKIRDALVGSAGAAVFSKIQWSGLADGLLKQGDK
jgi:hypothetical protein